MGLFQSILGKSSEENKNEATNSFWQNLESLDQLETLFENSSEKIQIIFKHSTRCIISKMALKQFENEYITNTQADLYLLDLLNYRDISNRIASEWKITHQSPQIIVIKNKKILFHDSHEAISAANIMKLLE